MNRLRTWKSIKYYTLTFVKILTLHSVIATKVILMMRSEVL